MPDALIRAGSIAFGCDLAIAPEALREAGLDRTRFVVSRPCTEHNPLMRHIVEITGEHDASTSKAWMDRVEAACAGGSTSAFCIAVWDEMAEVGSARGPRSICVGRGDS